MDQVFVIEQTLDYVVEVMHLPKRDKQQSHKLKKTHGFVRTLFKAPTVRSVCDELINSTVVHVVVSDGVPQSQVVGIYSSLKNNL
jgi:hypothetical protein